MRKKLCGYKIKAYVLIIGLFSHKVKKVLYFLYVLKFMFEPGIYITPNSSKKGNNLKPFEKLNMCTK